MMDLDGTLFWGPWPAKTGGELLRGRLTLPEVDEDLGEYKAGGVGARTRVWCHEIRGVKRGGWRALGEVLAGDDKLAAVVVSGREKDKHEMTLRRVREEGGDKLFEGYYLNPGERATKWKGLAVRRVREDFGIREIYLVDDDLRAGVVAAREIGREGEVYVLKMPLYYPPVLRRAGVELPTNLKLVADVEEAMGMIKRRRRG